ncbi:MAG: bifunctional riboflavin kinase/FAD synthetase [Eubacterium sp.]|nr:bifunctional riboflavin kinase/FAD synthetase [Eubacterium sp.]
MSGSAITIGKFNGFHLGHQVLLNRITKEASDKGLKAVCLKLVINDTCIFSDDENESFIREHYPSINSLEKLEFTPELARMSPEDFVRDILIDRFDVKYIAVGSDFRFGYNRAGDTETLIQLGKEFGFETEVIDKLEIDGEIVSSSRIRAFLEKGEMQSAQKLLGRPFAITGMVQGGKKLGRSLGYPTINLKADEKKILPAFGVYASRSLILEDSGEVKEYKSITNIGIRPSIDDGDAATIETFIYDFNEDIYGSKVSVVLDRFIRPEMKFSGLDELTSQISRDIKVASEV